MLKVDKVVPPDMSVKFEDKREELRKEVFEKKVTAEIPVVFKKLREDAKPVIILKRASDPVAQKAEARQELEQAGMIQPAPPKPR